METVIIVIHLMLVLALIGVVLLQKSEGGALGMGGGGGGGLMSSRGTANVLTRTTAILGAGFFATSVILAILAGKSTERPSSIIDNAATTAPATPAAPAGTGGGILDTLQQMQKGGQTAPAKPAGQ